MPRVRDQESCGLAALDPEHPSRLDVSGLGLQAFLFDLDGVVTGTASLHAQAWRRLFDEFLVRN